jgi:hypothetical protein
VRARFRSRRVDSDRYRHAVVRYIDANPVRAGVAPTAPEHEFGSARAYVLGSQPRWLCTDWVARRAVEVTGAASFGPQAYLHAFGPAAVGDVEAMVDLVEARMASAGGVDAIDDLIGRAPAQVRAWLASKARLADGVPLGLPVCGPSSVARALAHHLGVEGEWVLEDNGRTWRGSQVAHVGLLRHLAATPIERIGRLVGIGNAATRRRVALHRDLLAADGDYRARIGRIAKRALDELA